MQESLPQSCTVIFGGGMECMQAADGIDTVAHAKLGTPYYRRTRSILLGKLEMFAVIEVFHTVWTGQEPQNSYLALSESGGPRGADSWSFPRETS